MATAIALEPQVSSSRPSNNDALYEVVNGQHVELPPMSVYASWITGRLFCRLGPFCDAERLGTAMSETLFILDAERDLRRRPDVAFVSSERWPLDRGMPESGDWEVVPDLAVEVISPNDLFAEVLAKTEEYFRCGVRQVWIVLPTHNKVHVYDSPTRVRILAPPDELDGGSIVPGFCLPLSDLFTRQTQPSAAAHS